MFTVKGHVSELLYKHLPEFEVMKGTLADSQSRLIASIARRLDEGAADPSYWRKDVLFSRMVMGVAPEATGRQIQLTDGLLVVFAENQVMGKPRVLVLSVFESKSPSTLIELITFRRKKGQPRSWGGQFGKDFERLSELPTVIDGITYSPDEVVISRQIHADVAVTAKDAPLSKGRLSKLREVQGLNVAALNLPLLDRELNRVANAILAAAHQ